MLLVNVGLYDPTSLHCFSESQWTDRVACVTNSVYSCSGYGEEAAMLAIRFLHYVHELKCSGTYPRTSTSLCHPLTCMMKVAKSR